MTNQTMKKTKKGALVVLTPVKNNENDINRMDQVPSSSKLNQPDFSIDILKRKTGLNGQLAYQ